jgi:hypothetical protein
MRLLFDPDEKPPEGYVRAQPLHGAAYQAYDEASGGWVANPNSEALEKIDAFKAELEAIDREAGAGRAIRGLALAAAKKQGIAGDDFERLNKYEDRAEALREKIEQLS